MIKHDLLKNEICVFFIHKLIKGFDFFGNGSRRTIRGTKEGNTWNHGRGHGGVGGLTMERRRSRRHHPYEQHD
jgi:hypothetical protein